jgi:tRNA(adenine34) deaminase
MNDLDYMKIALKEAEKAAECNEVPVGAIIVCRNMIIARTHNQTELLNDVTAHAEMLAITAASNYLNGKYLDECTMYVSLEPCAMCAGAIGWSKLGKLVFGAPDSKKGFTSTCANILHPKTKVISGILQNECEKVIQTFFTKKR